MVSLNSLISQKVLLLRFKINIRFDTLSRFFKILLQRLDVVEERMIFFIINERIFVKLGVLMML